MIKTITAEQLYQQMQEKEIMMLDVRTEDKFHKEHISHQQVQMMNIPKTFILDGELQDDAKLAILPKDQEIIVTCTTGNSAKRCATLLADKQYKVTVLDGGMTAWNEFQKNKA